ncbi:Neuronal acetylcholine receptor subunit beta-4 [Branchiostoma belcheri]|nr:Neuronal acetylcholine receptor subunit beta-4 [Branchiostoma belcheri]
MLHVTQGIALYLFMLVQLGVHGAESEERLVRMLFDEQGYNPMTRPSKRLGDVTTVNFSLTISQLISVNEKEEAMKTNVWLGQSWFDHRLAWDSKLFNNQKIIRVPAEAVWNPDIVLFNNKDGQYGVALATKVLISSNGQVSWLPPAIFQSACSIDVVQFPFDRQNCSMKFGSWTYDSREVDLRLVVDTATMDDFKPSGEWDIVESPARRVVTENQVHVFFDFIIQRKPLFYIINLIIPCILTSSLSILVFYLPSDCGEKIGLNMAVLLAMTVFLLLIADIIPSSSLAVPLIGKYLIFTMIFVTMTTVATTMVLNVHHRTGSTHEMPEWIRFIFMEVLPKLLRMEKEEEDKEATSVDKNMNGPPYVSTDRVIESSDALSCSREEPGSSRRLGPEIGKAVKNVKVIADFFKSTDDDSEVNDEWQFVARVIDKLCLYLFLAVCVLVTLAMFFQPMFLVGIRLVTEPLSPIGLVLVLAQGSSVAARPLSPVSAGVSVRIVTAGVGSHLCVVCPEDDMEISAVVFLLWTIACRLPGKDQDNGAMSERKGAAGVYGATPELNLVRMLFEERGYNPTIRPAESPDEVITVHFYLSISQLISLNEKEETMKTNVWLGQSWYDPRLAWNKAEYENMTVIRVPAEAVWNPNIVLFNNKDGQYEVALYTKVLVYEDGKVEWLPPAIFQSNCAIDVRQFPFDRQNCSMKFGSWTYSPEELDIVLDYDTATTDDFKESGEWNILKSPCRKVANEKEVRVIFDFIIQRKPLFYIINLIIPCILTSSLSILVFYLPSDCGEKIGLNMAVLLAMTVFLLLIADIIPSTSLDVPLIGKYLIFTMIFVTMTTVATVLILNVHHRTASTHKMPGWIRHTWDPDIDLYGKPTANNGVLQDATGRPFGRIGTGSPGGKEERTAGKLPPELSKVIKNVKVVTYFFKDLDEETQINDEWKFVAIVIDRLCLWLFLIVCVLTTLGLFYEPLFLPAEE